MIQTSIVSSLWGSGSSVGQGMSEVSKGLIRGTQPWGLGLMVFRLEAGSFRV